MSICHNVEVAITLNMAEIERAEVHPKWIYCDQHWK